MLGLSSSAMCWKQKVNSANRCKPSSRVRLPYIAFFGPHTADQRVKSRARRSSLHPSCKMRTEQHNSISRCPLQVTKRQGPFFRIASAKKQPLLWSAELSALSAMAATSTQTAKDERVEGLPDLKSDLILRVARGEATERLPVWVMRQAGRSVSFSARCCTDVTSAAAPSAAICQSSASCARMLISLQ